MFAAVLPAKNLKAAICSTHQTRQEVVHEETVTRVASPESVDLGASVTAGIRTFAHAERAGTTKLDLEREVLARVLSLCPPGYEVEV
jgi:hypothetical protein